MKSLKDRLYFSFRESLSRIPDVDSLILSFQKMVDQDRKMQEEALYFFPMFLRTQKVSELTLLWATYEGILWRWQNIQMPQLKYESYQIAYEASLEILPVFTDDFLFAKGVWAGIWKDHAHWHRLEKPQALLLDLLQEGHRWSRDQWVQQAQLLTLPSSVDWSSHIDVLIEKQLVCRCGT